MAMDTCTTTFHGLDRSEAVDADVRKRFAALTRYYPAIMGGRVLVERTARHHRGGNRFHVRISVMLPSGTVVIEHKGSVRSTARAIGETKVLKQAELARDLRYAKVAVRQGFESARRRLQDRARTVRGAVKAHTNARRDRADEDRA